MQLLVVEDNPKLSDLLRRSLEEEGYSVECVDDGQRGLERALAKDWDLVVLDRMLPSLEGLEICRQLRATGCPTPILMLTARAEIEERVAGLDAGADDYVSKPFDLEEFLARVRALVRRAAGPDTTVRLGLLALDRLNRRTTYGGQPIDLTPREFDLLVYLVRASGRAVGRPELLREIWGIETDPGSNVVDAHIKKVREKLGDGARLLETVRGSGYRCGLTSN